MALARLPPQRINALDKCTCCVFDATEEHWITMRVQADRRGLTLIVANFKQLIIKLPSGREREENVERDMRERETRRGSRVFH